MVEIGQNMRNGYTFSSKVDIIRNCNALKTETSERPNLFRQNLRNLENKISFVKVEPSANNMLCHIKKRKLLYRWLKIRWLNQGVNLEKLCLHEWMKQQILAQTLFNQRRVKDLTATHFTTKFYNYISSETFDAHTIPKRRTTQASMETTKRWPPATLFERLDWSRQMRYAYWDKPTIFSECLSC